MAEIRTFDAAVMLQEACVRQGIDLAALVAETAVWASPEVHRRLMTENGTGAYFPGYRRARTGAGEVRGTIVDGVTLDDNTRANQAIKRAVGVRPDGIKGFEACHLWPGTAYDARYHTVIANLVLLPRAVAGLSDHDADVLAKLQYRAFELYAWHPEEVATPIKPTNYPTCWREHEPLTPEVAMAMARRFKNAARGLCDSMPPPETPRREDRFVWQEGDLRLVALPASEIKSEATKTPDGVPSQGEALDLPANSLMPPDELRSVIAKVRCWATKPDTIAHRTIGLLVRAKVPQARQYLARAIEEATGSSNGSGVVASLLTSRGNSYGCVLIDRDGMVGLHPDVAAEIRRHHWT